MSDSSSSSIKTATLEIQGTFEINHNSEETFKLLANSRRNQQENIKISIRKTPKRKKKHYSSLKQTKDLKCAIRLLSEKFEKMSEAKKVIVRELGFGGLMHIPLMKVPHKLLKELANSFNLDKNKLDTSHGSFRIKPKIIGAALGLNTSGDLFSDKVSFKKLYEENKQNFRRFQGKTLKNLTDEMMNIGVDNDQDRLMFKRIFILYIQMAFLLPTMINKVSPVHLAPIFLMDNITECNWSTMCSILSSKT
ncbi:hypothetical protein Ahy_B08g092406 [Arachis hypogaea]|uniref:Aminotransferase-like plant mobile domain-containing protein n=1 Tax=Arachis hypogaea TaxID=3818 RepID=A0A444Y3Q5_ARAHY|nr:hypothetical protein Ahy_B08g092406 [Arachis hypogaea]